MHAGICAARPVQPNLGLKNLCDRLFDFLLNADPDLLHLPTFVVGPVVRDGQLQSHAAKYPGYPGTIVTGLRPRLCPLSLCDPFSAHRLVPTSDWPGLRSAVRPMS